MSIGNGGRLPTPEESAHTVAWLHRALDKGRRKPHIYLRQGVWRMTATGGTWWADRWQDLPRRPCD